MIKRLIYIFIILLILNSCTSTCEKYIIKNKYTNIPLTVFICDENYIDNKFKNEISKKYINITNKPGKVIGFYVPNENTIYSVKDYKILLHEFWHFLGNLEEPYWETNE